jgi:hypothetical protein
MSQSEGRSWDGNANVSTTATYYIKTAADDVRKAMTTLETHIAAAGQAQSEIEAPRSNSPADRSMIQ